MTALEYLKEIRFLLWSCEGSCLSHPSNAEIKRWLNKQSIIINGEIPEANDEITFPIKDLILFPKGKRKTTLVMEV